MIRPKSTMINRSFVCPVGKKKTVENTEIITHQHTHTNTIFVSKNIYLKIQKSKQYQGSS
jgi:predicted ribonuclease YlaK